VSSRTTPRNKNTGKTSPLSLNDANQRSGAHAERRRTVSSSRGVRHRFLAYTFPSCSPRPVHPAVLNRRDFVEAAPALPTDPWLRLPPASPCCYDSKEMDGLSPPSATAAPRGAL